MMYLTLDYIKAHSRIDLNIEDELLELYGDAAEESVAGFLNRGDTVQECVRSLIDQYGEVPSAILQAALMLVDLSYQQRSPVSPQNMSVVPYTFDLLVKRFMIL